MKKITFISLSRSILDVKYNLEPVGGAENQIVKLASELSNRKNYEITFIIFGDDSITNKHSNIVFKMINKNSSKIYRHFKFIYTLFKTKPDVLITRAGSPWLFVIGLFSKITKSKLFFFSAHDWELIYGKKFVGLKWKLFLLGLKYSDQIFVQNDFQLNNFEKYSLGSKENIHLVKNLPLLKPNFNKNVNLKYFLWIGSYRKHKMPEVFIEAAKKLPFHKFLLVITFLRYPEKEQEMRDSIRGIPNLSIKSNLKRADIPRIYKNAKAVVITSEGEGFPNVAIEAWSQSRAVISSPNNSLINMNKDNGCVIYNNIDDLLSLLNENEEFFIKTGSNGFKYFQDNFTKDIILEKIISQI